MSKYCCKVNGSKTDRVTLLVSFAGHDREFGSIPRFEFVNFFEKYFKEIDRHFYVDSHVTSYHKGIEGLSTSIDETVAYLEKEIKPYKKVIFLGVSSGGYAAILFGSLLNITSVIAFIPQTIRRDEIVDEKYRDILPHINSTTKYYLIGDLSVQDPLSCHHISHCTRISHVPNVFIKKKSNFDLKRMRNTGELYHILQHAIQD
jgi:hypothetical protein